MTVSPGICFAVKTMDPFRTFCVFLNEPHIILMHGWSSERDKSRARRCCMLLGDFVPKPQIIVPSSCLTRLYHKVCEGKILPTLTIHKTHHCCAWCWCPVRIPQCWRILLVQAIFLALSVTNTRPWARPEAGQRELSGGDGASLGSVRREESWGLPCMFSLSGAES